MAREHLLVQPVSWTTDGAYNIIAGRSSRRLPALPAIVIRNWDRWALLPGTVPGRSMVGRIRLPLCFLFRSDGDVEGIAVDGAQLQRRGITQAGSVGFADDGQGDRRHRSHLRPQPERTRCKAVVGELVADRRSRQVA